MIMMWISPDVTDAGLSGGNLKLGKDDSKAMPSYRIAIHPEKTFLMHEGKAAQLAVGMAVMVDIHLGKRKVIDFLLAPIHKGISNSVTGK